ncbi:MAG TPA: hypothetical protein VGV38_18335, partial [Pyrinomonadaceae bacterium]|nr:hypothetical protein [Pyrinomonadaceae bacterium]
RDVTRQILSLGMTVGEPNAILHFQRPLWAAFVQGSRDRVGTASSLNQLTNIVNNSNLATDGEILTSPSVPVVDPASGYLRSIQDEAGTPSRAPTPWPTPATHVTGTFNVGMWNSIVPINVYNIREGWINSGLAKQNVYERGITQVVEINMRNLVRWLDGVYDANLLSGTPAASANIDAPDGYVIYFSDRRGDSVKQERDSTGATLATTNGMVDNEDIYGPNNALDPGEDVIDHGLDLASGGQKKGTLQVDLCELPSPAVYPAGFAIPLTLDNRLRRAREVSQWSNVITTANACGAAGTARFFRSAVRLFNGENLRTTGAAGKLSATKGITFATENMLYLWGNYNTTGINAAPSGSASSINDCSVAGASCYLGNQVPASIVCDAIFPLSKTWYDAASALFPEGDLTRLADANAVAVTDETAVRSGIVAGNNMSAMAGAPDAGNGADSRMAGGMHNFPRFLENWAAPQRRWNFTGSFVPLYRSTQAMGQWNYWDSYVIYGAPIRNWSFDTTFTDPSKLPPGTPTFQYIEPTGFRQVLGY